MTAYIVLAVFITLVCIANWFIRAGIRRANEEHLEKFYEDSIKAKHARSDKRKLDGVRAKYERE